MIPLLRTRLDRYALPLVLSGAAAAAIYNWRLWERDKALLARKGEAEPLLPLESWPERPMVSVLVAAWNEREHIERHIESFLALRYPHKELVLCAGGDDDTLALASRYAGPQVKVFEQKPGEGKQRALVRCFAETRGEIIFLTDADCELSDTSFERTLWPVVSEGEKVATGCSRPYENQVADPFTLCQWAPTFYLQTTNNSTKSPGILGRNVCLTRELLDQAWDSDETVATGTDYYLALRIRSRGQIIRRVPESEVATEFPGTAQHYLRQQTRWVKNLVIWGLRFEDWHHVGVAAISMTLGISMVILPLLLPVLGLPILLIYCVMWTHVIFARFRYVRFLETSENLPPTKVILPAAILTALVEFLAMARAAVGLIFKDSRDRW